MSLKEVLYESGYESLHVEEQLRKLSIVQAEVQFSRNDSVLDVGCGTGLSFVLGCKLVGIDSSEAMVELCRQRFPAVNGSAERLPFPDRYFDAVLCLTSIHHFPDIRGALDEMSRVSMDRVVIGVMRKSRRFQLIDRLIQERLGVVKVVSDRIDNLYFCVR
ncbi:class I SAM-dependent methyltransferase [Candidatus Woesearchaeota archaeon]|nr:class I SAM-dependent methyltransferase [Candidatus Woesearchaeota archaeon]